MKPPQQPSIDDVIRVVSAFCASHYPGDPVLSMRLDFLSGAKYTSPVRAPLARSKPRTREHSEDFRSLAWDGETFALTPSQAVVVRALWDAAEDGAPEVGQAFLLEAADSQADRLRDLFRDSPLWGRVVVPGVGKGTFRLAE